ncbi:MAG: PD-(D/E)XK nuclease family protein, partial [Candidatus Aminicenantes bacterium]|nr:PD-(D/E)XK nuclease family protein [Candidatus Aminicenantes bacterium]
EFIRSIPELLAEMARRLDDRQQATPGLVCRRVTELAKKDALALPQPGPDESSRFHWIFSGFSAMNSCERALFNHFRQKQGAVLLLRGDANCLADPFSPFRLQAETIRALGMVVPDAGAGPSAWDDLAAKVIIEPCDGVENEIFHAFRLLEEICRGRDEKALRRVAVLLPSAPSLIPFVQGAVSRFDQKAQELPFNITLGYPLERTPMMQLVDSLLTLMQESIDGAFPSRDYLQLIRHPYVKISGGDDDMEPLKRGIHLLEDIIHKGNLTRLSTAELEEKLAAGLRKPENGIGAGLAAEIAGRVREMHQRFIPMGITAIVPLLTFLRRVLESVGSARNRGAHLFFNEYAAAALAALEELEEFASTHKRVFQDADASALAAMVRSHFKGRTIHFEGSPLQGVQVMGPLEFRGLSFDEIIVLDALEGVLPGTAKYDPILPADIRAIFGVRDHSDWEKIYALNFFTMVGAARRVHILYPRRGEDGQERERSRFIERIAYAVEKRDARVPVVRTRPLPFAIAPRELRRVEKDAVVRRRLAVIALSPSSLEAFVRCPLQFYYAKVLGLRQREEVVPESEGGLIGTIVHEAMQAFFNRYPDGGGIAQGAGLERFLSEAFRRFNFDPERGLERVRAWALLQQLNLFLSQDRQRMAENGARIERQEHLLAMNLAVPGLAPEARIEGRIDRLEREGGLLRVIDYKTGTPFAPHVRMGDALDMAALFQREEREYLELLTGFRKKYPGMQLQVYLMLLAREQGRGWKDLDAAFVFLREKGGRMMRGIFTTGGRTFRPLSDAEKAAAMDSFVYNLLEVIRDIHCREHFLPHPADERYCSWCPYRLPCGNL